MFFKYNKSIPIKKINLKKERFQTISFACDLNINQNKYCDLIHSTNKSVMIHERIDCIAIDMIRYLVAVGINYPSIPPALIYLRMQTV